MLSRAADDKTNAESVDWRPLPQLHLDDIIRVRQFFPVVETLANDIRPSTPHMTLKSWTVDADVPPFSKAPNAQYSIRVMILSAMMSATLFRSDLSLQGIAYLSDSRDPYITLQSLSL